MRSDRALALVFANTGDALLTELTAFRSMASVPFGGRYRVIDFHLSNLVNAGIDKIGIIPRSNYRSLMDHIGSGKPWDLDRKQGGLCFLPPFIIGSDSGVYKGHIDAIRNICTFLERSHEEYVILCDADTVLNIDLDKMLKTHIKSGADVTVAYKHGLMPDYPAGHIVLKLSKDGSAKEVLVSTKTGCECDYGLGIYIFRRKELLELSLKAAERGYSSISRGILQQNAETLRIFGYEITGFACAIDGMRAYTGANMALLKPEIFHELFNSERPIYTKTRDDMPTRYGLFSDVKNSIVGDGCVIEGTVENCILFRGVHVGKNTVLKDSIIMQDAEIGDNCEIQYVTADKDVRLQSGTKLRGSEGCHFVIKKGGII